MRLMKNLIFVLILCAGFTYTSAQDVYNSSGKPGYHKQTKKRKKGYDPDKLILGGMPNLDFGNGFVDVGVSAIVGYRLTDHFSAGLGVGYLYSKSPIAYDPNNSNNILYQNENIIYPNLWARYFFYRNFFATATYEYDIISQKVPFDNFGNLYPPTSHFTNSCLFLGAGYRWRIAGRLSFYGELVYDVLQGKNSPYYPGQPTIHFGIAAGL